MLVWEGTVEEMLKRYDVTTYVNKMHLLFGSPSRNNSKVKYCEVFPGSVRVRTKHAGKTCVCLWGQLSIRRAAVIIGIRDLTQPKVWPAADVDVGPPK